MGKFDVILLADFRDVRDGGAWPAQDQKSKTVRNLLTLAHYRFGMFLKAQGTRGPSAIVLGVKRGIHHENSLVDR